MLAYLDVRKRNLTILEFQIWSGFLTNFWDYLRVHISRTLKKFDLARFEECAKFTNTTVFEWKQMGFRLFEPFKRAFELIFKKFPLFFYSSNNQKKNRNFLKLIVRIFRKHNHHALNIPYFSLHCFEMLLFLIFFLYKWLVLIFFK